MEKYRVEFESELEPAVFEKALRACVGKMANITQVEHWIPKDAEKELYDYLSGNEDCEYKITEKGLDWLHYIRGENGGYWNEDDYENGKRKIGSVSSLIEAFRNVSGNDFVSPSTVRVLEAILG